MLESLPTPSFTLRVPRSEDASIFARLFDAEVMRFIGDGTVRLSIGLEDRQDLIEDLDRALAGAVR